MQGLSSEKESKFFCCEKYNVYSMVILVIEFYLVFMFLSVFVIFTLKNLKATKAE